jgi:hypothetical protein
MGTFLFISPKVVLWKDDSSSCLCRLRLDNSSLITQYPLYVTTITTAFSIARRSLGRAGRDTVGTKEIRRSVEWKTFLTVEKHNGCAHVRKLRLGAEARKQ